MTQIEETEKYQGNASILNVSNSTITRIVNRFYQTGKSTSNQRTGRPKVTTQFTDAMICRQAVRSPFITADEIKNEMGPLCEKVSTSTIKRRLRSFFGVPARKPSKKTFLTNAMRKKAFLLP